MSTEVGNLNQLAVPTGTHRFLRELEGVRLGSLREKFMAMVSKSDVDGDPLRLSVAEMIGQHRRRSEIIVVGSEDQVIDARVEIWGRGQTEIMQQPDTNRMFTVLNRLLGIPSSTS